MHVHSERLEYQQITEGDWPFYLALNQDPRVMRYVSEIRSAEVLRRDSFAVRLPRWEPGSQHWLCLVMREKSGGEPVGVTGFVDRGEGVAEVGFLLAVAFHGKGYGIEQLRAICRFALADIGFRKLTAMVTAGNAASKGVLERAGFRQEGTLRESFFLDGRWQDDWIFGLLKRELG
jgi:RimJ/RimL family protein N-acetyltransferase